MSEPGHIRTLRMQMARATFIAREHPHDLTAQRDAKTARARYDVAFAALRVQRALDGLDDQQRAEVLRNAA